MQNRSYGLINSELKIFIKSSYIVKNLVKEKIMIGTENNSLAILSANGLTMFLEYIFTTKLTYFDGQFLYSKSAYPESLNLLLKHD